MTVEVKTEDPYDVSLRISNCTIKQIRNAEVRGLDIYLNDWQIKRVAFCGLVKVLVSDKSKTVFQIDDNTGTLKMIKWESPEKCGLATCVRYSLFVVCFAYFILTLTNSTTCIVVCELHVKDEHLGVKNVLNIDNIESDFNQMTYFFLDCIYQNCVRRHGLNSEAKQNILSEEDLCLQMLDNIRKFRVGNKGCKHADIFTDMGDIPTQQMDKAFSTLVNDVRIYSTIDDEHFDII